jgi:hypothetical protein
MDDLIGRLEKPEDAQRFIFAGNAIVTLRSVKTGTRFTYKIAKKEEEGKNDVFFVNLLSGPDNTSDYIYLGCFWGRDRAWRHDKKERVAYDAPSAAAWRFFIKQLDGLSFHEALEVWHEGRCCRCGRLLTVPESVKYGIGPECAGKMGLKFKAEAVQDEFDAAAPRKAPPPHPDLRLIKGDES